jgi:hypothetical protein
VEAWLLGDLNAFKSRFQRGPKTRVSGNPESISEPKRIIGDILAEYNAFSEESSTSKVFYGIAECVDTIHLSKACPKGFGHFRETLKEFILPKLLKFV